MNRYGQLKTIHTYRPSAKRPKAKTGCLVRPESQTKEKVTWGLWSLPVHTDPSGAARAGDGPAVPVVTACGNHPLIAVRCARPLETQKRGRGRSQDRRGRGRRECAGRGRRLEGPHASPLEAGGAN